jgi:hypothetical protein
MLPLFLINQKHLKLKIHLHFYRSLIRYLSNENVLGKKVLETKLIILRL